MNSNGLHAAEARRSKACEHCRALKVRCTPADIDDPNGPCVRCQRSKRECMFHLGPRKRTRKTDTRVAALEKKVEILSAALHSNGQDDLVAEATEPQREVPVDPNRDFDRLPMDSPGSPMPINRIYQPGPPTDYSSSTISSSVKSNAGPPTSVPPNSALPSAVPANANHRINDLVQHSQGQGDGPQYTSQPFTQPLPSTVMGSNGSPGQSPFARPRGGKNGSLHGPGGTGGTSGSSLTDLSHRDSTNSSPSSSTGRQKVHFHRDSMHPSLDGTPEDLVPNPNPATGRVDTGVDVARSRDKLLQSWEQIKELNYQRLEMLENMTINKSPSYENDVVAMGILSEAEAQKRLDSYRERMYPSYPIVELVPGATVEQMRRDQPYLFLAVMSVTSLALDSQHTTTSVCMALSNYANETLIFATMVIGAKTFELLQGLVLLTFWYNEPELQHHSKYGLLSLLALTIANDIGINGSVVIATPSFAPHYDAIVRPQLLINPRTLECRKIWLSVYCLSVNMSLVAKRTLFAMWTPYTEECCEVLEQANLPTAEKRITAFARMTKIFDEITKVFGTDYNCAPPDVSEIKTKYLINHFENRLTKLMADDLIDWGRFEAFYQSILTYLHQPAIYKPLDLTIGRAPFSEYSLALGSKLKLSPDMVKSVLVCYTSSLKSLEAVANLDVNELVVVPMITFSRMVFSVSMLLKLRALSLTSPEFRQSCPISGDFFKQIHLVSKKIKQMRHDYPYVNPATSLCIILQLLLIHYDNQVNRFFDQDKDKDKPANGADPNGNKSTRATAAAAAGSNGALRPATANDPPAGFKRKRSTVENIPGSPLDILSAVAVDGMQQTVAAEPTDVELPSWLATDDFWKDLVPNVEAFTGYDMM